MEFSIHLPVVDLVRQRDNFLGCRTRKMRTGSFNPVRLCEIVVPEKLFFNLEEIEIKTRKGRWHRELADGDGTAGCEER